MFTLTQ